MTTFSIAAIDELWLRGTLAERRLMHGRAEERAGEIVAVDARDEELVGACERAMVELRAVMPRDARVRLVARTGRAGVSPAGPDASRVRGGGDAACPAGADAGAPLCEATMTVEMSGVSIVTTLPFAAGDAERLRSLVATRPQRDAPSSLPILWHGGSAAVLLHEAIGHPAELEVPPIEWPAWLRVDCPLSMRRASFRDVPLRRMTRVVVTHDNAPFALPGKRIDVHLLRGGAYDPLTDLVTIHVAIADVDGQRLAPFTIRATRARIAAALAGATGEPLRYPGVVCSREGQELVVGSFAPLLVTAELT